MINLALILLTLLPFLLRQNVEAIEPVDSTCKSASEYLDAMYRCRAGDFQVLPFCASQSAYELNCNKSSRIAVFNASIGPSYGNLCSQSSGKSTGRSFSGSECCLLASVESKCHGKQKCNLNSVELLQSADGIHCASNNRDTSSFRIIVVFICINQKMFKELKRESSSPDFFCDGHLEDASRNYNLKSKPADIIKIEDLSTASSTSFSRPQFYDDVSGLTFPKVEDPSHENFDSTTPYRSGGGKLDWLWAFVFVKDNMDRFLIYLFLSIAVGVILVLLAVILGLCFGRRWQKRKSAKTSKEISHQKIIHSSTQTTDLTTSLIASNRTPGIEMVHYAQTDYLHALPVVPQRTAGSASATGNTVRFSPDDSTQQQGTLRLNQNLQQESSFKRNGGVNFYGLNFPQYQINSSRDSVDDGDTAGGRSVENEEYKTSTLGRFYSNPYRHDSYRSDGYRTLQNK